MFTPKPTQRLVLTIPEAAKKLGIDRGLAYRLAREDRLPVPTIRLGDKRMVISRAALERALAAEREGGSGEVA